MSTSKRPKPTKAATSSSLAAVPSKHDLLRLLAVVLIAASVAASLNLLARLSNPKQKPFCDSVSDPADDWVEDDFCEPCPAYGECRDGKLECVRGYKRRGRICIEDGDVSETARKLSQWAENRLCEGYVRFLCYGTGTSWVSMEDIWNNMDEHPSMNNFLEDPALYIYAKQKAMETIGKSFETRRNALGTSQAIRMSHPSMDYQSYFAHHNILPHARGFFDLPSENLPETLSIFSSGRNIPSGL